MITCYLFSIAILFFAGLLLYVIYHDRRNPALYYNGLLQMFGLVLIFVFFSGTLLSQSITSGIIISLIYFGSYLFLITADTNLLFKKIYIQKAGIQNKE